MIEINGHTVTPTLTIGGLYEYKAITGIDLLFESATLDVTSMRVIAYIMLKYGEGGETIKKIEDVDGLSIPQVQELVNSFTTALEGDGSKKKTRAKASE